MSPITLKAHFNDYDLFSEKFISWDSDFIQLDSGKFGTSLFQYINNNVSIMTMDLNRLIHQRATTPQGVWTFVIIDSHSCQFILKNKTVNQASIVVFSPGSEIDVVTFPGFSIYSFSFTEQQILETANKLQLPNIYYLLSSIKSNVQGVISSELALFRNEMIQFIQMLQSHSFEKIPDIADDQSFDILSSLLKLLNKTEPTSLKVILSNRNKAIKKVEEFIKDSDQNRIISISELLDLTHVSERTLSYAFHEYYGVSPKTYLKHYRLNQFRKALYCQERQSTTVAKTAKEFGYWHMGQLAKDYKKLFNEKPLETLKK